MPTNGQNESTRIAPREGLPETHKPRGESANTLGALAEAEVRARCRSSLRNRP